MDSIREMEVKKELALDAHLKHYEAIRDEITQASNAQNQTINYAIAIIAGVVSIFGAFQSFGLMAAVNNYIGLFFLIASILLAFLSWAALELEIRIHDNRSYIDLTLRRRIQAIIGQDQRDEFTVLKMEMAEQFSGARLRAVMRGILVFGKFAISYIPAIAFLLFFLHDKQVFGFTPNFSLTPVELFLFIFDIILCLVFPIGLMSNLFYVLKYYSQKSGKNSSQKPEIAIKPNARTQITRRKKTTKRI